MMRMITIVTYSAQNSLIVMAWKKKANDEASFQCNRRFSVIPCSFRVVVVVVVIQLLFVYTNNTHPQTCQISMFATRFYGRVGWLISPLMSCFAGFSSPYMAMRGL